MLPESSDAPEVIFPLRLKLSWDRMRYQDEVRGGRGSLNMLLLTIQAHRFVKKWLEQHLRNKIWGRSPSDMFPSIENCRSMQSFDFWFPFSVRCWNKAEYQHTWSSWSRCELFWLILQFKPKTYSSMNAVGLDWYSVCKVCTSFLFHAWAKWCIWERKVQRFNWRIFKSA